MISTWAYCLRYQILLEPCNEKAIYLCKEEAFLIFICWRMLIDFSIKFFHFLYFSECYRIFSMGLLEFIYVCWRKELPKVREGNLAPLEREIKVSFSHLISCDHHCLLPLP